MAIEFFASEYGDALLARAEAIVSPRAAADGKAARLADVIRIVRKNNRTFDDQASFVVDKFGSTLANIVERLGSTPGGNSEALDELYAFFYRVVQEFNLGLPQNEDLSHELSAFLWLPVENPSAFSPDAQRTFTYADRGMPLMILKHLLGSDVIINLRNINKFKSSVDSRIDGWEEKLSERESKASVLQESLKKYQTAFNFVGLYDGFDKLAKAKVTELWLLRGSVMFMGTLALTPLAAELWYLYLHQEQIESLRWALGASALPIISLTVLLAYFFRLAVRSADSAKSQLLQIELRKTLCKFIQSYSEHTKMLKDANADSLARFENIIFSGIVSNDDKIPATFDGIEQLAKLAKALKAPA